MPRPKLFDRLLPKTVGEHAEAVRSGARWFIGVGSLVLIVSAAAAVSHYAYGMPVYDDNTGEPSTPTNALVLFLFMGGSGALLAITGVVLRGVEPKPYRDLVAVGTFFALQCLYMLALILFFDI